MSSCSPSREKGRAVCMVKTEMQELAELYNAEYKKGQQGQQGQSHIHGLIPASAFDTEDVLVKALDLRLGGTKCKSEKDACWVEHPMVKRSGEFYRKLIKKAFKPKKPDAWIKKPREWLNTYDILDVMKQYEEKFPIFSFLGVFPVDFAHERVCLLEKMCDFHLDKLRGKGKTSFGMVLNLDKHDEPGSHWVSLFCSIDPSSPKYGISYFDSAGSRPPKDINIFMKKVFQQIKDRTFQHKFNPVKMQFGGSECGIFSMRFLIMCLEHPSLSYRQIRSEMMKLIDKKKDGKMFAFRDKMYR